VSKLYRYFRTRSIKAIIITSCAAIILTLVFSNVLASFINFRNGIQEAVNVQTWELSTQIVYNYENYIGGIIKTSNLIQTRIDRYGALSEGDALLFSEYLDEILHQKDGIIKIAVYAYDGGVYEGGACDGGICLASSNAGEIGAKSGDSDKTWFYEAIADPTVHVFSVPYSEEETGAYKVNVSKQIKLQKGDALAVLKIEISFQNFIDLIKKSNLGETGHIIIIDPAYNVVYASMESESLSDEIDIVRDIVLGSKAAFLNGCHMTVNVDSLTNTKWRICVFINIEKVNEIQNVFLTVIVLVSFAISAAGILLFLSVAQMITNPLKQLQLTMLNIEKADYFRMEEVNLEASKEVAAMTRQFNKMMIRINELMERVIQEQGAQRMSELKALQNQINPHFLYNTLESILWLVENGKNDEAGRMVVALARLFRISISVDSETIPLRDELEHVRNYLLIQNIRYPEAFDYEIEVEDESLLDCMTMKLILQPVVENSIYHGLKNKIDRGRIRIAAKREGAFLALSVADNGYGMRREAIDRLYASFEYGAASESVGLKNINQRIRIFYGGKAEMLIESELDEGTVITIREPLGDE